MKKLKSKLPDVGTTIFTTMSALAAELGAINLSQGFPDYDGSSYLKQRLDFHVNNGANQYAPMAGVERLNHAIAAKAAAHYHRKVDAKKEVTVTLGATEALFDAIQCVVRKGDEVIVFDPAYDAYEPAVVLAGGRCVRLPLDPKDFSIPWEALKNAIGPRTRLIIINSPHNPCGTVLAPEDPERLWQVVKDRDIYLLSDEVYEHIIFDGLPHQSLLKHDKLFERSFVVSSFGKTFHMTGWRVGYCIAPQMLSAEFRKVHQFVTFSIPNPLQNAIADMLEAHPEHAVELSGFYQEKRDFFTEAIQKGRFRLLNCSGSYFQLADYSAISSLPDLEFCYWMAKTAGVVALPISVLYREAPRDMRIIRFCFCKEKTTLAAAAEKLIRL